MGSESSKQKSNPSETWGKCLTNPWRHVECSNVEEILQDLESLQPFSGVLKILLYGPIGAGKSCFINSVQRSLLGQNASSTLESKAQNQIKSHRLKKRGGGYYPFVFTDVPGLEVAKGAEIQTDDIISTLEGHILDGYTFNPLAAITKDNPNYNHNPGLCDKVHCLVSIIPAESISIMDKKVLSKMKLVEEKASKMSKFDIPQAVVLTKVENACPIVKQDLRKVYQSRKIKEKVHECSNRLGLSLNRIYPVKNYQGKITQDANTDALVLIALREIVTFASDFVTLECQQMSYKI